jgi:hypothetical protein
MFLLPFLSYYHVLQIQDVLFFTLLVGNGFLCPTAKVGKVVPKRERTNFQFQFVFRQSTLVPPSTLFASKKVD